MSEKRQDRPVNYLGSLWAHKKKCVLIPLAVAALAYAGSMFVPKTYRAQASVAVTNISFGVNQMNFSGVPIQGLVCFFRSGQLAEETIAAFGLGQAPYNLTNEAFSAGVVAVDASKDAGIINVAVKLAQADLAAEVANFLARRGMENYAKEMDQQHEQMLKGLAEESVQKKSDLQAAEEDLERFQSEVQIETLRSRVEVQQLLRAEREARLARIKIELASVGELLNSYRQSIANEKPIVQLGRSLVNSPLLQQALAKLSDKPVENLLELTMEEAVLNPAYVQLSDRLAEAAANHSALAAEQAAIEQVASAGDDTLSRLRAELGRRERQLRDLQFKKERAASAATMSLEKLQDKRTLGIWPPHQLTLIPASIPDRPFWPRKSLFPLTALMVSFVAMWAMAIYLDSRRADS